MIGHDVPSYKSWPTEALQQQVEVTRAYLERDAGWIVGPQVLSQLHAELERIEGRFCLDCGVSLDLHPWPPSEGESTDPVECGVARRKAEMLDAWGGMRRPRYAD